MTKSDEQAILALVAQANAATKAANDALDDAIAAIVESNMRIEAMEQQAPR